MRDDAENVVTFLQTVIIIDSKSFADNMALVLADFNINRCVL